MGHRIGDDGVGEIGGVGRVLRDCRGDRVDISTLLKTYAHVIREDNDRVRSIVDKVLGGSAEDWLRTEAG